MKIKIYQNKMNGIISVDYSQVRFFNLKKLNSILKIKGLTIYSEYYMFSNIDFLEAFNEVMTLSKHSVFTNIETSNRILTRLEENPDIGYVLLIDGSFIDIKEENVETDLNLKKIRFFISIDYSENEVHLLINSNCYSDNLLSTLKHVFMQGELE